MSTNMTDVKGYRELNQEELAMVNRVKDVGINLGDLVAYLQGNALDFDQRWVSIGATHLQQGLMALTRAITKPTIF